MSQELLKQVAKGALCEMPTAKWIAQDPRNGDWFAYESEPKFGEYLTRSINEIEFVGTTELVPGNKVYEIHKILNNGND